MTRPLPPPAVHPAGRTVVLLSDVRGENGEDAERYMPLSIMAIGTALRTAGYRPVLIDVQVQPAWAQMLRAELPGAAMLGVSSLTGPSIHAVLEAVAIAREVAPEVPVVWGGYHATQAYPSIFAENLVDYVVCGAGERAVLALLGALGCTDPAGRAARLAEVPNLVYRDGPALRVNPLERMADANLLPPMDYTLIDVERYFAGNGRTLYYISSYGCPHACTFCAEPAQSLRRWRGLAATRVVDELVDLQQRYRPDRFNLWDPNFSSNPYRVVDMVHEMRDRGVHLDIFCDMRSRDVLRIAEHIDLRELAGVGFRSVFIGLESGSDRVLKAIRKGSTAADGWRACQLLDEAGIESFTSFIHDLPAEQPEDSDLTLAQAEALCGLRRNRQSHHFYTPYPMTELYDQLVASAGIELRDRTQREWADTSTFWGSKAWPGRPEFRRAVLRRLYPLHKRYPGVIDRLPLLRRVQLAGTTAGGVPHGDV